MILSDDIPFSGGVKTVVNLRHNTLKSISFLHNRDRHRAFTDSDMHSTMSNHMELLEPQLTVSPNTGEITETSECEKQELR